MDRFRCSYCSHRATIAPPMISVTQLASCLLGTLITGYLLLRHLVSAVGAFQSEHTRTILSDSSLVILALLFLAGFGYTFARAFINLRVQMRYRHVRKPV